MKLLLQQVPGPGVSVFRIQDQVLLELCILTPCFIDLFKIEQDPGPGLI
ncbi:unnamed protein product [Paramecium sonneborni]|uniref:Uncharacterized protein n=1 Tax=Paramecium sonneborni TaxID=65129 RepID=A0A8S1NMV4_9CILI|nr:unnamed protein product [Paramecium sonneborni]